MAWLRHESDDPDFGWPATLAELQDQGVPLPPGLAVVDLRWWQDQILAPGSRVRLPSLAELAKRWNWGSKDRVQRLLRREDQWSDPLKLDSWRTRRLQYEAGRKRDDGATTGSGATPPPVETRDDDTTDTRRDRDDGAYRRGDPPPPPPPTSEQTDVNPAPAEPAVQVDDPVQLALSTALRPAREPPAKPDRYDEAAFYFGQIVHMQIGRRQSFGPARNSKLGQKLLRAVQKDAELVLDAMRYVAEGRGAKADWLRGYDGLTVETILRHVDEYAELYRAEQHSETVLPTIGGAHPGHPPEDPARNADAGAWFDALVAGKHDGSDTEWREAAK